MGSHAETSAVAQSDAGEAAPSDDVAEAAQSDDGDEPSPRNGSAAGVLAIPTLAMLGGFSSAVVYRIINRLVETLESLVRGETREIMAAQGEAATARMDQRLTQNRLNLAANLTALQQKLNTTEDAGAVRNELNQVLNDLILDKGKEGTESTSPQQADSGQSS